MLPKRREDVAKRRTIAVQGRVPKAAWKLLHMSAGLARWPVVGWRRSGGGSPEDPGGARGLSCLIRGALKPL